MANGERWQDNIGIAVACPNVWELGTVLTFSDGSQRICKDRMGGVGRQSSSPYWVEMLVGDQPPAYQEG